MITENLPINTLETNDQVLPVHRPRSPRVPASFEVELSGEDTSGAKFFARARTIKVSFRGATIATDVALRPGVKMHLTPSFWKTLEAEVTGVWVNEADGRQHIGVKLLHHNGWFAGG